MKGKLIGYSLLFVMLCLDVSPSFAGDKPAKQDMSYKQMVSLLIDAQQNKEVVIIGLKGGATVSGKVVKLDNDSICLMHRRMEFFDGCTETIAYGDILSARKRNPVVKALKRIGAAPVVAAVCVGLIPYALYVTARGGI
ncbi:MAG TPA: hypothetical protein VJ464_28860 [Blastocatellia bacterium]|nr:hypothetical protein [Blastocatellia bacterium]